MKRLKRKKQRNIDKGIAKTQRVRNKERKITRKYKKEDPTAK